MAAQVTLTGEVTKDVTDGYSLNIKEDFALTYRSKDGEQINKASVRYWNVWLNHKVSLAKGTTVTVTGAYSTISGEPKADGKVWPNHKISDATVTSMGVEVASAVSILDSEIPF